MPSVLPIPMMKPTSQIIIPPHHRPWFAHKACETPVKILAECIKSGHSFISGSTQLDSTVPPRFTSDISRNVQHRNAIKKNQKRAHTEFNLHDRRI